MGKIDYKNALTMNQARALFAGNPGISAIQRWCTKGTGHKMTGKRVFLDSFIEGGRRFTTPEAIEKFREELNEDRD